MEKIIELESLTKPQQPQQEGQKKKRKSIFKQTEELHERLDAQRQDRLNSLTAVSASSWIARRLISNAIFGITGNLSMETTK